MVIVIHQAVHGFVNQRIRAKLKLFLITLRHHEVFVAGTAPGERETKRRPYILSIKLILTSEGYIVSMTSHS